MSRSALFYLAAVLGALVTYGLLFGDPDGFSRSMDFNQGPLEDFMGPYLETARGFLAHGRPAQGFLYPPSFALVLLPLADLDPGRASWLWLGFELLCSAALVGMGLALAGPRIRWHGPALLYVALTSVPLAHNLHWGQVSVPLGALVLAAALAQGRRSRRAFVPEALVACAAAIKVYPLAFLAVPLARREPGRVALGLVLALFLAVGLPALAIGPQATFDFLGAVGEELARRRGPYFASGNAQALAPVLARWTGLGSAGLLWVLGAALALSQAKLLCRVARDPAGAYGLVAACLPLVVEPHWPHYFVWLPFLQLLVLVRARGDRVCQGLAWGSVLCSNLILFRVLGPEMHGRLGLLLVADLLVLAGLRRALLRGLLLDDHGVSTEQSL
jgi:Glycosyltransferase family 87